MDPMATSDRSDPLPRLASDRNPVDGSMALLAIDRPCHFVHNCIGGEHPFVTHLQIFPMLHTFPLVCLQITSDPPRTSSNRVQSYVGPDGGPLHAQRDLVAKKRDVEVVIGTGVKEVAAATTP